MKKFINARGSGVLKLVLSMLLLFCLTEQAYCAAITWNGPFLGFGNGNWNTGSNWSTGTVPTISDDVTINELLLGFTISLSAPANAKTITVNSAAGLLGGVTISTGTSSLTVANGLNVGAVSVLLATSLTISGSGPVTLETAVNVFPDATLNFASGSNVTTTSGTIVTGYNSASINNSGTLTAASSTFNLSGSSLANSGTLTANLSTFNLTGSSSAIANTGTFILGPTSIIYPTAASSSVSNTSPGVFTLQSTAGGSAAIGIVGGSVTGIFNVERFITGGNSLSNRGYRLLSSPVNQTNNATIANNTFGLNYLNQSYTLAGTTYYGAYTAGPGGATSGFNTANNNALIYLYDESQAYNNQSFTLGNNVPVNAINAVAGTPATSTETVGTTPSSTVSLPIGNGFSMYFVGSTVLSSGATRTDATTANPPTNATLTANGYINQGSFTVKLWKGAVTTLSYTTTPAASHPYPCTINLQQLITDNTGNIDNVYLLSALDSPNQFYLAYTANGNSAPPAQGYAVSGEGFLVHATGTGKTLTFNESEKVPATQLTGASTIMVLHQPQASMSRTFIAPQGNTLTGLYMELVKDSTTHNYCGIYFSKSWSDKYGEDDAIDMDATSGGVVMSSLSSDSIRLAVNHMSDYTKGINVKLYVNANADGLYNLKINDIRNIDTLYDIYLIDHYKQDSLDIRKYGSYAFNILKSDTTSFGGNRFELSVHPGPLPVYKLLNFTAQKVTTGVQVSWKTEAEGDYTGFVLQKADGTIYNALYSKQSDSSGTYTYTDPNPVMGNNTYRLQQSAIAGNLSYSSPVTIIYNPSGANGAISVYPNPAMGVINLTINQNSTTVNAQGDKSITRTITNASYSIKIINITGMVVKAATSGQPDWQDDVSGLSPGTYIIQVLNNSNKTLIGKSAFVKL